MSQKSYRVHIQKEALKFSAAHMTVFPDGTKEALHGHNYMTEVEFDLEDTSLSRLISFSVFKDAIRKICQHWDEKVLIPQSCPFLEIKNQSKEEVEFLLCGKRYVLPIEEVVFLPVDNVTSECLAQEFCRQLIEGLGSKVKKLIVRILVRIDETPGQGCTFMWSSGKSSG